MKRKRPEKRRPTDEEASQAADAKLKRFISKSAIDMGEKDDDVKRQMVAQTFGYKLPDQAEKSQKELITCINELAIKRLKEDDKLMRAVAEARIRQVTEEMGLQIEGGEWRKKPLSLDDYIERARKYKELKEVMGVKEPGIFDAFTDPKVIATALQLASELLSRKQAHPANSTVVLVNENGEETEMTREEYEQLKAQGNVQYLSDVKKGDSIKQGESNGTTTGPETSTKDREGDRETGDAGSGK